MYLQSTHTTHWQHLQLEAHSGSGQKSVVESLCGNSPHAKAVGYFCKRALSSIFDRILNAALPNGLLQLKEGLGGRFTLLGLQMGTLGSLCLQNLLIYTKYKNSKMKSWTNPACLEKHQKRKYKELIYYVDKANTCE